GRRHRDDAIAAIAADGGRALDRPVALEIVARHDAARRADGGDELVGDGAAIERGWSVAGDGGERVGEVALQQGRARGGRPAGGEEELRGGGPAREGRWRPRQRIGDVVLDGNAVARQRDRRRDQLGEREFARAIFRVRERQPRDRAGNSDGERGVLRFAWI